MTSIIISLFSIAALDLLDPYGVSSVLMLLQLVRKDWHVLPYIWSCYITYWISAVGIYYGVHKYVYRFIHYLTHLYRFETAVISVLVGVAALIAAVVLTVRIIRNWHKLGDDLGKVLFIKSVHPVFLVFFGVTGTLGNIPAAWPLFGFIGILLPAHVSFITVVLLMSVFTLFSILPMQAAYMLYRRLEAERFARFMNKAKHWLARTCLIVIPLFLAFVSIWSINEGLHRLLPPPPLP